MSNSVKAWVAKCFLETVTSPEFDSYIYQGKLIDVTEGVYQIDSSIHLITARGNTYIVIFDGVKGCLEVQCINVNATVLTATFEDVNCSWVFEGVFSEDVLGTQVIHACKVLKRLHLLSTDVMQ